MAELRMTKFWEARFSFWAAMSTLLRKMTCALLSCLMPIIEVSRLPPKTAESCTANC